MILTAAILVTVFTVWEIVMGFTNQVFKWIGDVANDLGESKANQMFVGVAGGAKGASTGMANANAMKGAMPGGGKTPKTTPSTDAEGGDQVDNTKNTKVTE